MWWAYLNWNWTDYVAAVLNVQVIVFKAQFLLHPDWTSEVRSLFFFWVCLFHLLSDKHHCPEDTLELTLEIFFLTFLLCIFFVRERRAHVSHRADLRPARWSQHSKVFDSFLFPRPHLEVGRRQISFVSGSSQTSGEHISQQQYLHWCCELSDRIIGGAEV